MKTQAKQLIIIAMMTFTFTLASSCSNKENNKHAHESKENTEKGKEYTSSYICPMYCEGSGSEEAGQCPVCHMDYVVNQNAPQ